MTPTRPNASVQIVASEAASARAIAATLADVVAAQADAVEPGETTNQCADVVVLGFESIEANSRHARALRGQVAAGTAAKERPGPVLVMRCGPADAASAARCVRSGLVDDYVADDGADPQRLATTVLTAMRLALALRPARARPLVLMVEDDEFSHELVAAVLAADGVELIFETDGAAALDRIRERRPDVVLMDVMLPGHDGVELTQRMKADAALASIPIVMVTGEARRETLVRSMEAGAADFVVKPFTPDALRSKLARFLPQAG